MPNRKYSARFPPARIKKIMRTDKEVGKVAASVPVAISRALELFAEQLIVQAGDVTAARGSRTLSPAHLKQCVLDTRRFDFLRQLVADVPDATGGGGGGEDSGSGGGGGLDGDVSQETAEVVTQAAAAAGSVAGSSNGHASHALTAPLFASAEPSPLCPPPLSLRPPPAPPAFSSFSCSAATAAAAAAPPAPCGMGFYQPIGQSSLSSGCSTPSASTFHPSGAASSSLHVSAAAAAPVAGPAVAHTPLAFSIQYPPLANTADSLSLVRRQ